jgi:hypothetical protein
MRREVKASFPFDLFQPFAALVLLKALTNLVRRFEMDDLNSRAPGKLDAREGGRCCNVLLMARHLQQSWCASVPTLLLQEKLW